MFMFKRKYIKYRITEREAVEWRKGIIKNFAQYLNSFTPEEIDGIMNLGDKIEVIVSGKIETKFEIKR